MFPFLHEDVLYIINEYAREHTKKRIYMQCLV